MSDDVEEDEDAMPSTPPAEGWTLREAVVAVIDGEDRVRLSQSDESERHYSGRLRDLESDPDPRDGRGDPIDVAGLRKNLRDAAEQARRCRAYALRQLRQRIGVGDLEAHGWRSTTLGTFEPIPAQAWSAFDWLDLETNAVGEAGEGGGRWVGVRIFGGDGGREIAPPREPSPYPSTERGAVAAAFDKIRPNGKQPNDRNDTLFDEIRTDLGFGGGRPSDSTIREGIRLSNMRHGRTSNRGGDRRPSRAPENRDVGGDA